MVMTFSIIMDCDSFVKLNQSFFDFWIKVVAKLGILEDKKGLSNS